MDRMSRITRTVEDVTEVAKACGDTFPHALLARKDASVEIAREEGRWIPPKLFVRPHGRRPKQVRRSPVQMPQLLPKK